MFKVLFLLIFSLVSFADDLIVVNDPDIAENGWYWVPSEPGYGLNVNIQPANFVASGYFMFGSIFTQDENGEPIWYTYQGEYLPNEDVFAWREGRGLMGSFESPLFISSGGSCPTCPYTENTVAESDLGIITLEWKDPLNLTMRIGDTVKELTYQYWHAGLQNPDMDFITEGAWYVQGIINRDGLKGLVSFEKVSFEELEQLDDPQNTLILNEDFIYYQALRSSLETMVPSFSDFNDQNGDVSVRRSDYGLILAHDPDTNITHLLMPITAVQPAAFLTCAQRNARTAAGILKPAVGSNSRFYYKQGVLESCPDDLTENEKRQVFISLTRLSQGGDDLATYPVFRNRN